MKLYIGNKNYSSWSMRPWVLLTQAGIAFEEVKIRFDAFTPESAFKTELARHTPAGRVPVLVDEGFAVWDTLAIAEYLAEQDITAALAHPFYAVEAPLTPRHRRRLARLFPIWEVRNGARAPQLNSPASVYIETHGGTGIGGSDDHAGIGSAVNNAVARLGSLFAVAVLPAAAGPPPGQRGGPAGAARDAALRDERKSRRDAS